MTDESKKTVRQERLDELMSWCKGDLALRVLELEDELIKERQMFDVEKQLPLHIHQAALTAEAFFRQLKVQDVRALEPFTYHEGDAWEKMTVRNVPTAKVSAWYPWNRWTRAIATTFGDGDIYINARKTHLFEVHDYVNTLIHETMHNLGFSHGNNYFTPEKAKSVPYAIGALAESWSRGRM